MKSWSYLILWKNKWSFFILGLFFVIGGWGLNYAMHEANTLVTLPIAVQKLDERALATTYVEELRQTAHVQIIDVPKNELFLTDYITQQRAAAVVIIPADFEERLNDGDTKGLLQLYVGEAMPSDIAQELLSKVAYRQQLPVTILKHLTNSNVEISLEKVRMTYEEVSPTGKLTQRSFSQASAQSISGAIVACIIFSIATLQVVLNRSMLQIQPLQRAQHRASFYSAYTMYHAIWLTIGFFIVRFLAEFANSFNSLVWFFFMALLFEIGIVLLLTFIRTWSHQMFMAIVWTALFILLVVSIQVGGIK